MIKKAIIKPHQIKRRSRYPRKDEHKVDNNQNFPHF